METVKSNQIMVPCDFTPLSYHAIAHGAYIAKLLKYNLLLLNVVPTDADVSAVEKKLSFVAEECHENFGIKPETMIRVGRPYSTIRDVAIELNPKVVVLKTGGKINRIAHHTGIRTIKILSGTIIPFLVIQDAPKSSELFNIVFPINFLRVHDAKLKRVVYFSHYYPNATMHIITPSGVGTEKEKNIANSLVLMEKVLEDQDVRVNFITHNKKKNKAEDILEISKEVNADMIMIQMEDVPTFSKFLFGLREEKLITNQYKIPVLCIHRLSDFGGLD